MWCKFAFIYSDDEPFEICVHSGSSAGESTALATFQNVSRGDFVEKPTMPKVNE